MKLKLGLGILGFVILFSSYQVYAQLRPMAVRMILPHGPLSRGSLRMNQQIAKPMKSAITGNTDRDFAIMSAEAFAREIELAKLEVRYGKNAKLKKIARFIIDSHRKQRQRLIAMSKSSEL